MNLTKNNLSIRNAMPSDATQLCVWWNDGTVMAHAGFPNGLGIAVDEINIFDGLHIIELDGKPIGEMNYHNVSDNTAAIGIKICDNTHQEKGLGTTLLSMFIDALFTYYGFDKIILDTNVKNKRAQHVYEKKLGFRFVRLNENAWKDQLGEPQSTVDYELYKTDWAMKINYIHIRREQPADCHTVEELTREAFWHAFWGESQQICDEHLLTHKLRSVPALVPELDLVAEIGGQIAGHIIYTVSKIVEANGTSHDMLTFGPLAVHPKFQSAGVGKALMQHSFKIAKELGYRGVLIFGHANYYPRVGFKPAREYGFTTPGGSAPDPFMAYPLYPGAFDGVQGSFHLDPVYESLTQEEALEFDNRFSPKEQHKLVPMDVLLNRLEPTAREAIPWIASDPLALLQTRSEREMLELVDETAIKTIRTVLRENNIKW